LILGIYAGCSAQAAGRERGKPIDFSQPKSDEISTNLYQLRSKKDSLKQLEEDLNVPLQSFTPKSSLEGVAAPMPRSPTPSVIQSKRAKELLERRKNWVFMNPEDLIGEPTIDQILKSPEYDENGQQKGNLPAIELYYQRLMTKRASRNTPGQTQTDELFSLPGKSSSADATSRDDSSLPAGIQESADALRSLFQSDDSSSPFSKSAVFGGTSDRSGFSGNATSKEQTLEHKKLMDEYHTLLDPNWHPPVVDSPGVASLGGGDAARAAKQAASVFPTSPTPTSRRSLEAQMDIRNPLLGPQGLPDVNAQALGQTRPAPVILSTRETKAATATPAYVPPKRAF